MGYIEYADVQADIQADTLLRLLDDDKDGVADASVVASLMTDMEAELDGYIQGRYDLALIKATQPKPVRRIAISVFLQFAYQRKPSLLNEKGETPAQSRYNDAQGKLKGVAAGTFRFDVSSQQPATPPANVQGGVFYGTSDTTPDGVGGGTWKNGFGDF